DIKKGTIIYTVNEKINAIAPKITSKGATTIQNEVNQTVVKTVSEVVLKAFKEAGIEIEKQLPKLSTLENTEAETIIPASRNPSNRHADGLRPARSIGRNPLWPVTLRLTERPKRKNRG
ncbi:MAG: hypothetical protein KHY68_02630, partial [Collinsella sp.]|nr:hypothetical protein [Collinsella sp.]